MIEEPGRMARNLILEGSDGGGMDEKMLSWSQGSRGPGEKLSEVHQIGWALERIDKGGGPKSRFNKEGGSSEGNNNKSSDMDAMKERFAKLLLGEDMSGGGKGVSSALALSNAITNLAASVFGEQSRLEPMSAKRKARWRKEIDWLLSVTDHIVEFVPSQQMSKDGTSMEIMVTRQRNDLHLNIPALRKLDAMLLEYLDNFKDQNEFWYESQDKSDEGNSQTRQEDKWWLPMPKVPQNGLSDVSRKWLQFQKDSINQVLKAALAINAQVLSEMEIPEVYIESLPKNGRASLGDSIYRSITDEYFDPDQFLSTLDLSTEHKILDVKNRIEASVIIWKRKMTHKDSKSSWSSGVSMEKREIFEERAETILVLLKHKFPGIPQSVLDISKIQYNKDVGQSVLESYSRILESLAFTVLSRIEDVLFADARAQDPSHGGDLHQRSSSLSESSNISGDDRGPIKFPDPDEEMKKIKSMETNNSMTLSDFMGWHIDHESETMKKKKMDHSGDLEELLSPSKNEKFMSDHVTNKVSYIENLGGLRSPTSRH